MSSMPELIDKLTEREKAKFATEQDAAVHVREARTRVMKATEELMEMKRAHEQELLVVRAQYEKRIRDSGYECRQRVHRAQDELSAAEASAEKAEGEQRRGELCANNLAIKLRELRLLLDCNTASAEECLAALSNMMQIRLERVEAQADGRIADMTDHAQQVHSMSRLAIDSMAEELHDQMSRAHHRAEGRTRFKDLTELSKIKLNYDISEEGFQHLKSHLVGLWHAQKQTLPSSSQSA